MDGCAPIRLKDHVFDICPQKPMDGCAPTRLKRHAFSTCPKCPQKAPCTGSLSDPVQGADFYYFKYLPWMSVRPCQESGGKYSQDSAQRGSNEGELTDAGTAGIREGCAGDIGDLEIDGIVRCI